MGRKNSTEQERNCLNSNGNVPIGSMNEIENDSTKNECEDTEKTKKSRSKNQQESDRRWYIKNKFFTHGEMIKIGNVVRTILIDRTTLTE